MPGKLVSRHMSNCRLASPPVRTSVGEPGWGVSLISGNNRWFWEFEKSEPKNHRFPEFQRPPKNQPGFTKEPEGTRRVSLGYLTLQNPRTAVMSSIIRGFDFFDNHGYGSEADICLIFITVVLGFDTLNDTRRGSRGQSL